MKIWIIVMLAFANSAQAISQKNAAKESFVECLENQKAFLRLNNELVKDYRRAARDQYLAKIEEVGAASAERSNEFRRDRELAQLVIDIVDTFSRTDEYLLSLSKSEIEAELFTEGVMFAQSSEWVIRNQLRAEWLGVEGYSEVPLCYAELYRWKSAR